jgi:hypothetical protein
LETGKELWDVPQNMANLESEPGWPLLFGSVDGGQRIPLTAFDPRTREAQWVVPVPAQGVVAQSQRIALSSVGGTPPRLTAHRIRDGRVEWSRDATSNGTVVASGHGIFLELFEADAFDAEGELVAIDAATGATRWKASNPGRRPGAVARRRQRLCVWWLSRCRARLEPIGRDEAPSAAHTLWVLRRGAPTENPGGDLLSRGVSPQVPSARAVFTAVFGMGTGVSPPLLPPETVSFQSSRLRELQSEHEQQGSQALGRLVPVG